MSKIRRKKSLSIIADREDSQVKCQVHGEFIRTSCKLSECVFHTKYPNVHNCILVYMMKQGVDSLKPLDIGMLKGIPSDTVARELNRATNAMRTGTLRVSNQVEVEAKFITLPDLEVCYACEASLTKRNKRTYIEYRLPKSDSKVFYCSEECAAVRPPHYIGAEMECRTDIKTVLEWATKKYSTLGGLEQALSMNRTLLGDALKQVLGIEAEELYPTTQRVRTRSKSLVRRTGSRPEWLNEFSEVFKPLISELESVYTESVINIEKASEDFQRALDNI